MIPVYNKQAFNTMEDLTKSSKEEGDKGIVYSKAIKAGKRIYYLDVKKSRKDEMFLAITESKKVVSGEGESSQVNFEKHKIFLYKEDFDKFLNGLQEAIRFIERKQGLISGESHATQAHEPADVSSLKANEIKIDINF